MASKHEPLPPLVQESAMDYAEHQKTYSAFVSAVKYSIISMAILALGLYFSIIGHSPFMGIVLIFASIIVPAVLAFMSRR